MKLKLNKQIVTQIAITINSLIDIMKNVFGSNIAHGQKYNNISGNKAHGHPPLTSRFLRVSSTHGSLSTLFCLFIFFVI